MCDLRKCAETETAVMSELRESEIAKVPVARMFVIAGALVIAGAGCNCGCRLSLRVPAVIAGAGCHCGCQLSLRATTRNPVLAYHWIPDQVRDDHGISAISVFQTIADSALPDFRYHRATRLTDDLRTLWRYPLKA
jgi:hypothetical protein